uniref:Uncharacterized protein n=1 Tax=Arundo donax TaxID=35708 RepID=A0A0A8Z1I4_ARUDO
MFSSSYYFAKSSQMKHYNQYSMLVWENRGSNEALGHQKLRSSDIYRLILTLNIIQIKILRSYVLLCCGIS